MIANNVSLALQSSYVGNLTPGQILDADRMMRENKAFVAAHHGKHGSGYLFDDDSALVIHNAGHHTHHHFKSSPLQLLARMLG